jgi:hypothetical protein
MNLFSLPILKLIARGRPINQILYDEQPYLERFYLFTAFNHIFYLHRMLAPDGDRDLHNHPWQNAHSIVLHGSYIERRLEFGFQKRKIEYISPEVINIIRGYYFYQTINRYNHLSENSWHTIMEIHEPETWTLFWHSIWYRPWGFLRSTGFQKYKEKLDGTYSSEWWKEKDCKRGKDVMQGAKLGSR